MGIIVCGAVLQRVPLADPAVTMVLPGAVLLSCAATLTAAGVACGFCSRQPHRMVEVSARGIVVQNPHTRAKVHVPAALTGTVVPYLVTMPAPPTACQITPALAPMA